MNKARGFTLIELMITVLIVAILAAVAVPAYQNQVAKTNRSAAKACLAQYSQFMERVYTTALTYVGGVPNPALGCTTEGKLENRYTITVANVTATTYRATATPTAVQSAKDSRCGTLTLDEAGVRGAGSNSAADISFCW
jgi:type IV pilus assembly protein PilE